MGNGKQLNSDIERDQLLYILEEYIQQNKVIVSYMNQKQSAEIKEYKEFTTITNIRKLTQEAITPVVKSIEAQMSQLVNQNNDIRKNMTILQQMFKQQTDIQNAIKQNHQLFEQHKSSENLSKCDNQKRLGKLDSANEKILIEVHTLKNSIAYQNQSLDAMKTKNEKMSALYASLDTRNDLAIKAMQDKYTHFTGDIIKVEQRIKDFYSKSQSQIEVLAESFKRQRNNIEEKQKGIDLFFKQRDLIHEKIEDIYNRLIDRVTREEFEGFRKSQLKNFEAKMQAIDEQLLQILPVSLRKLLPEVQVRLKQVDKIKGLSKKIDEESNKLATLKLAMVQNKNQQQSSLKVLNDKVSQKTKYIEESLRKQINKVEQVLRSTQKQMNNKFTNIKDSIQSQIQQKFEKQSIELHKTIQHQIRANMTEDRDEELQQQLDQIREIKDKLYQKSNFIEEIAESIDQKIMGYSSKITKIKSDYELFADGVRKEISGVIKMRQKFSEHLSDIGAILSTFAEFLLISGSFHYESLTNHYRDANDHQIFVTQKDGIIYEFKDQIKKEDCNKMVYRRKGLETKHFIKSYMFGMVSYFDEVFEKYQFLEWEFHKPSEIFLDKIMESYLNRVNKATGFKYAENDEKYKMSIQPFQQFQNDEFQATIFENMTNNAAKKFNRTISSRIGGTISRKQRAQNTEQKSEIKKNYSIKKTKSSLDKNRYEQNYLSSRAKCRSRVSQMF